MWQRLKHSILFNILLMGAAVWIGYRAYTMARQAMLVRRESHNLQERIEGLTQKKKELEAYLTELQSPAAREREAKERLNLKLSGEEVVVVVPEKKEILSSVERSLSWWERITQFTTRLFSFIHP